MWEKKEWEVLEGVMRGDVTMNDFQLHPGATSAVRRLVLCISRTSRSLARSRTDGTTPRAEQHAVGAGSERL